MSAGYNLVRELEAKPWGRWGARASPVKVYRDGQLDVGATRTAYKGYISDPGWRARRARLVGSECHACGDTENLHLHHLTYEHVGRERPWELMTLCASCHTSVHAKHRQNRSQPLAQITHRYAVAYRRRRGL